MDATQRIKKSKEIQAKIVRLVSVMDRQSERVNKIWDEIAGQPMAPETKSHLFTSEESQIIHAARMSIQALEGEFARNYKGSAGERTKVRRKLRALGLWEPGYSVCGIDELNELLNGAQLSLAS